MTNAPCAVGVLMKNDENMYSCVSQIQLYFKNQPFEKNAKKQSKTAGNQTLEKSEENMQIRKAKNMQRKMQRTTCFFSVVSSFVLLLFFKFFGKKREKNRTRFIFVFSNCFFCICFFVCFFLLFQLSVFAFAFSFVFFSFSNCFTIAFFLE